MEETDNTIPRNEEKILEILCYVTSNFVVQMTSIPKYLKRRRIYTYGIKKKNCDRKPM
jgi:hypothetical protein